MKYDVGTFFKEHADPTVPGFTIIEVDESDRQYRVAEKWEKTEGSKWLAYWLDESKLHDRVDTEKVEEMGSVNDDQFEAICQRTDSRVLAKA